MPHTPRSVSPVSTPDEALAHTHSDSTGCPPVLVVSGGFSDTFSSVHNVEVCDDTTASLITQGEGELW